MKREILKNIEAKIKVSTITVLMILISLSGIFLYMSDTVKADGDIWVNQNFEGGADGADIIAATNWTGALGAAVTFTYNDTTVLAGSTSAQYLQDGDPGDYDDSLVEYNDFTPVTENCTWRYRLRINSWTDIAFGISFINKTNAYDGVNFAFDEHRSFYFYNLTEIKTWLYNSTGVGGDETTAVYSYNTNYTFNFQINWTTKRYLVEYYDWSTGLTDYLCTENDGTGGWLQFRGTDYPDLNTINLAGSSGNNQILYYIDNIQLVSGLFDIDEPFEESGSSSVFSVSGLDSSDRITFSGVAGTTVWSNETSHGTLEINYNVNASDNCTEIRINLTHPSVVQGILNTNISIVVDDNNASFNYANAQAYSGTNITINESVWDAQAWCTGTNPFPIDGGGWTNGTIYVRFKLEIDSGASSGTYTVDDWNIWWKVLS